MTTKTKAEREKQRRGWSDLHAMAERPWPRAEQASATMPKSTPRHERFDPGWTRAGCWTIVLDWLETYRKRFHMPLTATPEEVMAAIVERDPECKLDPARAAYVSYVFDWLRDHPELA